MDKPTCETCVHWGAMCECTKLAPVPKVVSEGDHRFSSDFQTIWVVTDKNDSCGEHQDFPKWLEGFRKGKSK